MWQLLDGLQEVLLDNSLMTSLVLYLQKLCGVGWDPGRCRRKHMQERKSGRFGQIVRLKPQLRKWSF